MNSIKELRQYLKDKPGDAQRVCKLSGLTLSRLGRKLYNPGKFNLFEILIFRRVLNLTMDETIKIFAPLVVKRNTEEEGEEEL